MLRTPRDRRSGIVYARGNAVPLRGMPGHIIWTNGGTPPPGLPLGGVVLGPAISVAGNPAQAQPDQQTKHHENTKSTYQ